MKKILCIGEALIDMICTDTGKPLSQGEHFLKKAGGAPANVAAAIAALGGQVEMTAKVGVDPFGQHVVDVLNTMGVGTRFMFRDSAHFTTMAFVSLTEDGERDFYFNRGADGELNIRELSSIQLNEFSIIHFGSATAFLPGPLQSTYLHMLQQAINHQIYVSFDPNYRSLLFGNSQASFIEQAWIFLKSCQFFKLSAEEAMLITTTSTVQDAAAQLVQKTNAVFAITLGSEGTMLGLHGATHLIESIPVKPIDTTGAGDAFVGAVLYQLQHLSIEQRNALSYDDWNGVIKNGNKAGARTCEYLGAMEAFKNLSNSIFE